MCKAVAVTVAVNYIVGRIGFDVTATAGLRRGSDD
jgi:hypothetical protein